jgi:chromosome segregation ATPase
VNADSKIAELQEQLERLTNHKKELEVSTLKNDEKLSSKRSEVSNIRAEISTIEVAPC